MSETADQSFKKATLELLVQKCYDAASRAHVPYSKFPGNVAFLSDRFCDPQIYFTNQVKIAH